MYPSSRHIPKYHIPLKSSCEYLERQSPTKFDVKLALWFDMYILRTYLIRIIKVARFYWKWSLLFLRRHLANHGESLPAMLMTRLPLADGDAGQCRLQIDVSMIDMSLKIALILGAEGAVRTAEGRCLAAFIQHVSLQDVRVLVALAASRAIVTTIVVRQATPADARVIVVTAGRVSRRTMKARTTLRRQRSRHFARRCRRRRRRRRRGVRTPRGATRTVTAPAEAGEETCKRHKQTGRGHD